MNKMKRIFSFVLVFAILVGSFSSFSTVAFAEEAKKEDAKVEEVKEEAKEEAKEEEKEEEKPAVTGESQINLHKVPADVKGTEYENAVAKLVAFGIAGGYPDGEFKADKEIKRAEFAKMLVVSLGLEDAAVALKDKPTGFADVDAYIHWASGYINVAASQNIVQGYENGNFQPEKNVSYDEVLTMLVRALGYEDQFVLGQKWPANYISKAAELGITKAADVSVYNQPAKRGYVAQYLTETLEVNMIDVTKYENQAISYVPSDKTILFDKLGISKSTGVRLLADNYVKSGSALKDGGLKVDVTKGTKKIGKELGSNLVIGKTLENEYREYLGKSVTAYYKGSEALVVENAKGDAKFDFVKEANKKTVDKKTVFELEFELSGGRYDLNEDSNVYIFDKADKKYVKASEKVLSGMTEKDFEGRVGRVVISDDKIAYAELMSESLEAADFMVVKKVDAKNSKIVGLSTNRGDDEINWSNEKRFDEPVIFNQDGSKLAVEDVKAGDVVYAQELGNKFYMVAVQGQNVTGELGRAHADNFDIDSDNYKVSKLQPRREKQTTKARISTDLLESSEVYTKELASELYREEVIAYRGAGDLVVLLAPNHEDQAMKFGIVTRMDKRDGRMDIFTEMDGKEDVYRFNLEDSYDLDEKYLNVVDLEGKVNPKGERADITSEAKNDELIGEAVRFRVNAKGDIAAGSLRFLAKEAKIETKDVKFGEASMYFVEGKEAQGFRVVPTAPVVQAYDYKRGATIGRRTTDNFFLEDFEAIKNTEYNRDSAMELGVFVKNNGEVEGFVFYEKAIDRLVDLRDIQEAAFLNNVGKRGSNYDVQYHSFVTGRQDLEDARNFRDNAVLEEKPYLINVNRRGNVSPVLDFKLDKDGKMEALENKVELTYHDVYRNVKIVEVKDNLATVKVEAGQALVNGELVKVDKTFKVNRNAVLYNADRRDEAVSKNRYAVERALKDFSKGEVVDVIATKGGVVEVMAKVNQVKVDSSGKELEVEYLNKDRIFIDGERYTLDKDSVLYAANGKTILALGGVEIEKALEIGFKVKEVKSKDGVLVSMVLAADAKDVLKEKIAEAKTAATKAEEAATKAGEAATKAGEAATEATTDYQNALQAKVKAEKAVITAEEAVTTAEEAVAEAATEENLEALATAKKVLADAVKDAAEKAEVAEAAEAAKTAADAAKEEAEAAKEEAEAAKKEADEKVKELEAKLAELEKPEED